MRTPPDLLARITARCTADPVTGCWLWGGATAKDYGAVSIAGVLLAVHRVVYELLVGPIPEGLELDHGCRRKACCNPDHLEPVTHRINVLRGTSLAALNAAKVVCLHGHPLAGANLYLSKDGRRHCRQCRRDLKAAYRVMKKTGGGHAQAAA